MIVDGGGLELGWCLRRKAAVCGNRRFLLDVGFEMRSKGLTLLAAL